MGIRRNQLTAYLLLAVYISGWVLAATNIASAHAFSDPHASHNIGVSNANCLTEAETNTVSGASGLHCLELNIPALVSGPSHLHVCSTGRPSIVWRLYQTDQPAEVEQRPPRQI